MLLLPIDFYIQNDRGPKVLEIWVSAWSVDLDYTLDVRQMIRHLGSKLGVLKSDGILIIMTGLWKFDVILK